MESMKTGNHQGYHKLRMKIKEKSSRGHLHNELQVQLAEERLSGKRANTAVTKSASLTCRGVEIINGKTYKVFS